MPYCNQSVRFGQLSMVFYIVDYVCYDCEINNSTLLCKACFESGDHRSHRFIARKNMGGLCDCGNEMMIKSKGFCPNHTGKI